ncbi:MAG TPA: hypothetical protein VE262_01575 [Blastocatellia bacterium]|nr:hypothetical protein [Blastocatellia bacterium]
MYRALISRLIEECAKARDLGTGHDEIRARVLPEKIRELKRDFSFRDFLEWVREDREYSSYYFDVQQDGACAKPDEVAALVLEEIVFDSI